MHIKKACNLRNKNKRKWLLWEFKWKTLNWKSARSDPRKYLKILLKQKRDQNQAILFLNWTTTRILNDKSNHKTKAVINLHPRFSTKLRMANKYILTNTLHAHSQLLPPTECFWTQYKSTVNLVKLFQLRLILCSHKLYWELILRLLWKIRLLVHNINVINLKRGL